MGDLRDVGSEPIDVIERNANLCASLFAAGLHGRSARDHNEELGSKVGKDVGAGAAETIAVGKQHDDGGDSPGHAEHGEGGAAPVVAHGVVGFL